MNDEPVNTEAAPEVAAAPETPVEESPAADVQAQPASETGTEASEPAEERKPSPAKTLLDDEDEPASPEAGSKEPKADDAPSAEAVETWCKSIPSTDLGDGVTWSDDTLRAMAPTLMSLKDDGKANAIIKAYSDHMQSLAKRQQEASEAFNNGQLEQCRKEFGTDLPKVAKAARTAGRAIFGDTLWNALKSTPEFANNPDVLRRLADAARFFVQDDGAVRPLDGQPAQDGGDVLHRMYGNVKVG